MLLYYFKYMVFSFQLNISICTVVHSFKIILFDIFYFRSISSLKHESIAYNMIGKREIMNLNKSTTQMDKLQILM